MELFQFVDQTMPSNLKESYPRTRMIIDCTELFLEMPSKPRCQSATFSTYIILLVFHPGETLFLCLSLMLAESDQQITRYCGILNLLQPGDEIMADRGFAIVGDLPSGVILNMPPFLNYQPQFSQQD